MAPAPARQRIAVLVLAAFVACAWRALAAEVQLSNGQTLRADQVIYEGQTGLFTFQRGKTKLPSMPAAQVRYVRADEPDLTSLTARLQTLQADNEELRKATAKKGIDWASVQDDIKRRGDRILELSSDLDAGKTSRSVLERRIAEMTAENAALRAEAQNLRQTAAVSPSTSSAQLLPAPAGKALPPRPQIASFDKSPSKVQGLVEVKGVAWNNTGRAFSEALIETSAYDASGRLLATSRTFIPHFRPGERRPFRTDLEADYTRVAKVEVAAGAVFSP